MFQKAEWKLKAAILFGQGLSVDEVFVHPEITVFTSAYKPKSVKNKLWMIRKEVTKQSTPKVKSFSSTTSIDEIFKTINPEGYNPFGLPTPEDDSVKTIKMPVGCDNVLIISDLHFPFHSVSAITAALKYGLEHKVNTIIINGDLLDFYALSRFEKDKRLRNLPNELEMTRQFLAKLRQLFPDAYIVFKLGNHSDRWARYIRENAGEFDGMDEFLLENILHLPKLHINMVESKAFIQLGKLMIIHGHELYGSGGVNPARSLFLKAGCSALMSHVHRTSEHIDRNLKDEVIGAWSIGCLSELRPSYNPGAKYNHGFGHVTVDRDGTFQVKNMKILNGKIY